MYVAFKIKSNSCERLLLSTVAYPKHKFMTYLYRFLDSLVYDHLLYDGSRSLFVRTLLFHLDVLIVQSSRLYIASN